MKQTIITTNMVKIKLMNDRMSNERLEEFDSHCKKCEKTPP